MTISGACSRWALPITVVQLLLMLPGVEDSVIVGRLGAVPLARIALGSTYFFAITGFGLGLLMGVEPVIAQAVGAGEPDAVARAFQRGPADRAGVWARSRRSRSCRSSTCCGSWASRRS